MNKVHSVHMKIDAGQFKYLSSKGNKSEYMRELIKKDMQGGNDNVILMEALRLMALKQLDILPVEVKPAKVVQVVKEIKKHAPVASIKPVPVQGDSNLLDQFGWDDK